MQTIRNIICSSCGANHGGLWLSGDGTVNCPKTGDKVDATPPPVVRPEPTPDTHKPVAKTDDAPPPDIDDKLQLLLFQAGFETMDEIDKASDDDLLAIKGIGKAALEKIRAA